MNKEEVEKEREELCNFLLNENRKLERQVNKAWETQELLEYRINKAIDYIEYRYVDEEYVKKQMFEKNLELEDFTIECTAKDFIELLNILKGSEENEK